MEADIYTMLASVANGEVYPMVLPQGESYPAIVYEIISDPGIHNKDGLANIHFVVIDCFCYGSTYEEATTEAQALLGLDGYSANSIKEVYVNDYDDDDANPDEERFIKRIELKLQINRA